jgi:hypothetical protein
MVQHPIAAIQLCGALLTAAYLCYTLLLQPRDLVWYMKASSIAFFKLVRVLGPWVTQDMCMVHGLAWANLNCILCRLIFKDITAS